MSLTTIEQSSVVNGSVEQVWGRVTTEAGISHEMMPFLRMRMPRRHRGATVDTVPVGVPLGRAWLFLFGVLPFDYDAITITELVPNSHFQERSTMLAMRRWEHRRTLEAVDATRTRVTDVVGFQARIPALGRLLRPMIRFFFAHRHRRLATHFRNSPTP